MNRRAWSAVSAAVLVLASCRADGSAAPTSRPQPDARPAATATTVPATAPGGSGAVLESTQLEAPAGVAAAWKVRYRSTSVEGEPVDVTGIVARPSSPPPPGGYPVLSWAHGTIGVADACAPSNWGAAGLVTVQAFLDAGFVVAATDYEGLGTPGVHPYLVAESEGRGVLDVVRAAGALVPEAGERVVVMGHSQGGHAALATSEIATAWAPELELVGTIAVAPVGDLEGIVPVGLQHRFAFGFGALVVAGWSDAYADLDAADLLTPAGLEVVEVAKEQCVAEVFEVSGDRPIDEFVSRSPEELPEWRRRIEENTIHPARVEGPVLLVQGGEDPLIPERLTLDLLERLCDADVQVHYRRYERSDHGAVVLDAAPDVVAWAQDRLEDRRPPSSCEG